VRVSKARKETAQRVLDFNLELLKY
jgi:hypothetical protein